MWRGKKQTDRDAATLTSVTLGSPGKKKGQRVQTTEANEGQVDMWSSNKQQQSNTHGRGWWKRSRGEEAKQASSRGRPMQNADWTGLDWIGSIDEWTALCRSLAANGGPVAPRRRARPRFSQIELDPPCGAPNWDKGGWNNKAEPLDCPLTNGSQVRADGRQAGQGGR